MKPVEVYTEYCTGCGLCHAAAGIKFERDETGFNYPILQDKDCDFLKNVCPAGGKASRTYYDRYGDTVRRYILDGLLTIM